MSPDPADPIDYSLERIADLLERIADALEGLKATDE